MTDAKTPPKDSKATRSRPPNRKAEKTVAKREARRSPERTRERILKAAISEFSGKGPGGARVDTIARRSGANKRMIYHYFGSKEGLFLAALERTYGEIREAEAELHLEEFDPMVAMRKLVEFNFAYYIDHPHFIPLLNAENVYRARHLRKSDRIQQAQSPIISMIRGILRRGQKAGVFRKRVDPLQLYITIAALGYFYFANMHTLSTAFGQELGEQAEIDKRRRHAVEVVLGYLSLEGD
ncbi:MAG: TetR/AcrR family transcriptional regulator [Rhodovibrionaceae bacterium]